jgi:hypothetical protein
MAGRDTASQKPHILVLWDIDHTLIETRGVGRAIYEQAFPAVTGKPLRQLAEVAGRTELVIMHDTLQLHDVESTEQMMRCLAAALIQGHEYARAELVTTGRVLPGAEALAALASTLASTKPSSAATYGMSLASSWKSSVSIRTSILPAVLTATITLSARVGRHRSATRDRANGGHIQQPAHRAYRGHPQGRGSSPHSGCAGHRGG